MKKTLLKAALIPLGMMYIVNALADDIPAEITSRLEIILPGYDTNSVKATPISGLYEFIGDGRVLYISADGRYIVTRGTRVRHALASLVQRDDRRRR